MRVYLRAKSKVSGIFLMTSKQGIIFTSLPQNEPLKSPIRLGLKFQNPNFIKTLSSLYGVGYPGKKTVCLVRQR